MVRIGEVYRAEDDWPIVARTKMIYGVGFG